MWIKLRKLKCSSIEQNDNTQEQTGSNTEEESNESPELEQNPVEDFAYKYDEELQGVRIAYVGDSETVIYPSEINGDPVLSIEQTKYPEVIKEIYIPNGVEIIGLHAFSKCINLDKMTIPNTIRIIDNYAFQYCKSLSAIHIPNSVDIIGFGAFKNCDKLLDITFENTDKLVDINSDAFDDTYWHNRQEDGFISLGHHLLNHKGELPEEIVIPDRIKAISGEAMLFMGEENVKSIQLPEGLEILRRNSLAGFSNVTNIKLPDSLKIIGDSAFYGNWELTEINLPRGLTSIEKLAFNQCKSLKSIEIPDGITSIDENTFTNCDNLTEIIIPPSVIHISNNAFDDKNKLNDATKKRIRQINPDALP